MRKKLIMLTAVIAIVLAGCGQITPPENMAAVTTTAVSDSSQGEDSTISSPEETQAKEKQRKDTFIAEFWGQNISFVDTTELVKASTGNSSIEIASERSGNQQKLGVKSKSGAGTVDVMCIDMSKAQLGYSLSYILSAFGDNYHSYTLDAIDGITSENLISENSEMSVIVSKGRYSHSASIQKTDNSGSHYGWAETVIIIKENKLTLISGSFISTDMMERQSFASLIRNISESVDY